MFQAKASLIATMVFAGLILVLAYPYAKARLSPIQPLPEPEATLEQTSEVMAPDTLQIPSLGIEAPIKYTEEESEAAYQLALRDGVVRFPQTPEPGELGNVYIFGHSSDYVWTPGNYKTVFARLPEIALGSQIKVSNAEGQVFTYTVFETKIVSPRDLSVLDQYNYERKILSLQASYPLGTALQRFIVIAELDESQN
ncbi:MAG: sortase [Patescibacteria group bacterium]